MELIVLPPRTYHVSQDTVAELESAILADSRVIPAESNRAVQAVVGGAARLFRKAGLDIGSLARARGPADSKRKSEKDYFAVMMEVDSARVAPWFIRGGRRSIYLFDAWPGRHRDIRQFVEAWGIQYAFVSSSGAAERLSALSDRCTFMWVPEGIDPARYRHRSFLEKDIDVLQLGRRYDAHHSLVAPELQSAGKIYLYEKEKGAIVFPSRADFVDGLARTRISICVPSSVTHPERAGGIETMTVRYLQSMVSKCLVLGRAPEEMIEMFGYNPIVEIDMSAPGTQILELLGRYEDYLPLVERNYEAVSTDHTWAKRWERMASVLFPSRG